MSWKLPFILRSSSVKLVIEDRRSQEESYKRAMKAMGQVFKDEVRKYERSLVEHQALLKTLEARHGQLLRKLDDDVVRKDKEIRKTAEAMAESSLAAGPLVEPPPVTFIFKPPGS